MARPTVVNDDQKKLQGHTRFVKNTPDTKPISRLWQDPGDLGEYGSAFHRSTGKILVDAKVFTNLDKYPWFENCRIVNHLAVINKTLQKEGYVIGSGEKAKKHPAAMLYNELLKQFQGYCAKFGLTPADRKKIDLPVDDIPQNDPVKEFLFGKR